MTKTRQENVGSILGKEKPSFRNKPSNEWILPDTSLGVEIEVEGVGGLRGFQETLPRAITKYWDWEEDPSLHEQGCEFTFKTPMFGEDAAEALRGMLAHCEERKWKTSLRTGIHVHMDARDLSDSQLLGLIAYYVIFEPAIYAWVGDNRESNNFCLPWYKSGHSLAGGIDILDAMRRYLGGADNKYEVKGQCDAFHRYAGLNLKALGEYGSLEFRQLKTTTDYARVRDWINILLSLKKAALDVPDSTMTIIHGITRRGVDATMAHIFGESFVHKVLAVNPQVLDMVRKIAIPNAVEIIGTVTKASGEFRSELLWNHALETTEEKKNHPGFLIWKRSNFPKGAKLTKEEYLQQLKQPLRARQPGGGYGGVNLREYRPPRIRAYQAEGPVPIENDEEDPYTEVFYTMRNHWGRTAYFIAECEIQVDMEGNVYPANSGVPFDVGQERRIYYRGSVRQEVWGMRYRWYDMNGVPLGLSSGDPPEPAEDRVPIPEALAAAGVEAELFQPGAAPVGVGIANLGEPPLPGRAQGMAGRVWPEPIAAGAEMQQAMNQLMGDPFDPFGVLRRR